MGGQPSVPNFEKGGGQKNEFLGSLEESLPQIFASGEKGGGLIMFLVKKDFVK